MSKPSTLILVATIAAAGCAYTAPYRSSGPSGPSPSEHGVQVGIAGIRCYVNRAGDPLTDTGSDEQAGLDVKLQINNDSDQQAEVDESHLLLAEAETSGQQATPPRRSNIVTVPPGGSTQIRLAYSPAGATDCRHDFALDLTDSVQVEGSPVPLAPIIFEPKP